MDGDRLADEHDLLARRRGRDRVHVARVVRRPRGRRATASSVRVANSAGSNAATFGWTVTAPAVKKPTVTFTQTPRNRQNPATFAWTTTNSPTSVTCALDGAAVTPCSSPLSFSGLRRGLHTFVVTAANSAGSASARDHLVGVAATCVPL